MNKFYNIVVLAMVVCIFMNIPQVAIATTLSNNFYYNFNSDGTLYETGSMIDSPSPYWWVNSGAILSIASGLGSTAQGSLATSSPWRIIYAANNPVDTDNGYHPQNIFRLVSKKIYQNLRQELAFRIVADNLSSSPNRNGSNGVLLFNRYQDSANLYYTGVRVDGAAVIKKKIGGIYYTMAYKKIFFNPGNYDRALHPNLIPKNTWIGLRSEVVNNPDGTVNIKLYTDVGKTGTWTLALEATDDNVSYGGNAITQAAYAGIRTDFMDVKFDNYSLQSI